MISKWKQQMREKVKNELEHIPNWPDPQGELRMIYNIRRMHSLSKKVMHLYCSPLRNGAKYGRIS